ncbi:hypothetical protein CAEBREN_03212 [Caenorhabditis brenneri]|uniref:CARD domain-containing protein n=1 Tax=Caenorhabditis brenneri TaxID=135651 RepID=G0MG22_CAEBE|nr:hypothetical protein CAEBREN_03212 [Caenorhabditis brenneri]
MLHDIERRALEAAHPMLIEDLEPRDALTYLKDQNISTEEHLDLISSMPTRPERIAQFLRAYRKQASALAPLIDFFVYNSQFHFSDFFEERLSIAIENPELLRSVLISPIFGTQMLERKLLLGNVPKQIDCYCRAYNVEGVIEKLSDMCNLGSFFLFLHGRAGSGKSVIASQALSILDQLIGIFYDSVVWLKDSGTKSKSTFYLSEEDFLKFPSVEHFTSVVLKKMKRKGAQFYPDNRSHLTKFQREQERMAEEEKKRLEKERLELEQKAQAQRRLEGKKKEEEKLKEELSKIKELVEQPVEQEDALRQALLKQRELRMGRAEEQLKEKMKQASSEKKTKKEKKNKKKDRRKESNRHDTSSSSPSSSSTSTDSSDSDSKTYSSDDSRRHRYRRKRRSTEHHDHRISHTHRDEKVRRRGS